MEKKPKKTIDGSDTCVESCSSDPNHPYEYQEKFYAECPIKTVNVNNICKDCHSDCTKCSADNVNYCQSCNDFNKYLQNGHCISDCSKGYYTSSVDSSIKIVNVM